MLYLEVHEFFDIQQTMYSFFKSLFSQLFTECWFGCIVMHPKRQRKNCNIFFKKMKHVLLEHLPRKTSRFPDRKNELKMTH